MTWLTNLGMRSLNVTKNIGKIGIGGSLGRSALGAAIGGIYSTFASDQNDPNQYLGNIARGAFLGGMIGAGTRLFTPAIKFGAKGISSTGMPMAGRMVRNLFTRKNFNQLRGASNILTSTAGLAIKYPTLTAGVALGGYTMTSNSSPYSSPNRQSFMNSTNGLVQGMHQGRHGGR